MWAKNCNERVSKEPLVPRSEMCQRESTAALLARGQARALICKPLRSPVRQKNVATPGAKAKGNKITSCSNLLWISHVKMQTKQNKKAPVSKRGDGWLART